MELTPEYTQVLDHIVAHLRSLPEDKLDDFVNKLYPGSNRDFYGNLHVLFRNQDGTIAGEEVLLNPETDIKNIMVIPLGRYLQTYCPLGSDDMRDDSWDALATALAYIGWVDEGPHLPDFHLPRHHL